MDSEEFHSPFDSLPFHVAGKIMDFLQLSEKKDCRFVSHHWNYIMGNYCQNIKFDLTLENTSFDQFIVSNQTFDSLWIEGLTKRFPRLSHPKNHFPNVKHIDLSDLNSEDTIMNIFKYGLEYTKSLRIGLDSLKSVRSYFISGSIQHFKWNHLIKLEIVIPFEKEFISHVHSTSTLLEFIKIPNLRQFYFIYYGNIIINQKYEFKRLFLNIYTFLSNHSQSLKELNICINNFNEVGCQIPQIDDSISSKPNGSVGSNMNIQICHLNLTGEAKNFGFEYLIFPCVIGSKLKNLSINIVSAKDIEDNYFEKYRSVFEANVKSLEIVRIDAKTTVDLFWMKECFSLRSLSLNVKELILPIEGVHCYPFKFNIVTHTYPYYNFPYEQCFIQFGKNIEHLKVEVGINYLFHYPPRWDYSNDWFWIESCVALTHLSVSGVHTKTLLSITGTSFPNLIEFHVYFVGSDTVIDFNSVILITPDTVINNWKWIAQNMPNLQILKMSDGTSKHPTSLACLRIALTMKKLTKIDFNIHGSFKCYLNEEIRITHYCEYTPGLFLNMKRYEHISKAILKINHSVYKIST